ncbi:pirin family protein [Algoriphagus sp.]|uniref:pirin family protein n=1 Tax=Algoriphagus sp. TaxID=1872435 RepID=UPI002626BFCE|nr:pirin family protein [Algoriphagus sp.]
MTSKRIELIAKPNPAHFVGDGFRVHNFIPSYPGLDMKRMDPFIMLDYNSKYAFPASSSPKGVGVHPHRGFETVTIAYKGKVEHHDSAGGGGVIGEGGVQWMTAASGVLHKEYHEREWSKTGGDFQMVQLWVNLPAQYKMSAPKYQALDHEKIAKVNLPEGAGIVEVIAGEFKGIQGSASTFSPLNMLNTKLEKDGQVEFTIPADHNTAMLVVEGSVRVNDTDIVPTDHLALFENKGENFTVFALQKAVVLILSGEPLNEPIAAHGPFVMNTRAELMEAFRDFNEGKFGYLED